MRFKPSLISSIVLFSLSAGFAWMASWQMDRAAQKSEMIKTFQSAQNLNRIPEIPVPHAYHRVMLKGRFDTRRHVLVDNQVFEGRAGVHVLTPFFVKGQDIVVLVNRGWLPLPADRRSLPAVPTNPDMQVIEGHLAAMYRPGIVLGELAPLLSHQWPQLLTYPDMDDMAQVMDLALYPLVLYSDPASPAGFADRDWKIVAMGPEKHRGYAFQWLALMVTCMVAWVVLAVRRGRGIDSEHI